MWSKWPRSGRNRNLAPFQRANAQATVVFSFVKGLDQDVAAAAAAAAAQHSQRQPSSRSQTV